MLHKPSGEFINQRFYDILVWILYKVEFELTREVKQATAISLSVTVQWYILPVILSVGLNGEDHAQPDYGCCLGWGPGREVSALTKSV